MMLLWHGTVCVPYFFLRSQLRTLVMLRIMNPYFLPLRCEAGHSLSESAWTAFNTEGQSK